jgi:hypothetical protein
MVDCPSVITDIEWPPTGSALRDPGYSAVQRTAIKERDMSQKWSWALAASMLVPTLALASAHDHRVEKQELELVARLDGSVGNITFTPDQRVIFSYHPFFNPSVRVAELLAGGKTRPFPNVAWNTPRAGTDQYLDSVLGLRGDENGIVWLLDAGTRSGLTPKIVAWDTRNNRLHKVLYIPQPISLPTSFIQDLILDVKRQKIYLADEGIGPGGDGSQAALIVIDIRTGLGRRLLQGHESVLPLDRPIASNGKDLVTKKADGSVTYIKVGVDGIAADRRFEWLYFGPLSSEKLWRVRIGDIIDEHLSAQELAARVQFYADKPFSGGFTLDRDDNLYLTDVSKNAVGVIRAKDRKYQVLVTGPELHWPDGLSFSPDGHFYVSAAQIDLAAAFHDGQELGGPPFLIYRFRGLAPGRIGH